jgi:outer membrane protein OmpA-like peptidoglycan-associated protein
MAVVLTGYSDGTGSAPGNHALSVLRAKAVAAQLSADLTALKVTGVKITVKGASSSHPVVSNANATKRALNRRVVATLS